MRSCGLALLVLVLTAGSGSAAEGGKPEALQVQDLAWLVGDWEGQYVLPEGFPEVGPGGSKVVCTHFWHWTLGKKFIGLTIRDEIDGKIASTGDEILGRDQGTKTLAHWFFGSTGGHGRGEWSGSGDTWAIKWHAFAPGGKKYEGTSDHIRINADTYTWQMRDIKENGKSIPDWPRVTFKRRKAVAADDLWTAYRDAAAGTWKGTGELISDFKELGIAKGDKFTAILALKQELEGKSLMGETDFRMVDNPFTAKARALAGWDPDTRQIRFVAFWSGSLLEEIVISRRNGNKFFGIYTAKSPGNETLRAPIRIEYPDADSYVITFVDGPQKGEILSSWKRAK